MSCGPGDTNTPAMSKNAAPRPAIPPGRGFLRTGFQAPGRGSRTAVAWAGPQHPDGSGARGIPSAALPGAPPPLPARPPPPPSRPLRLPAVTARGWQDGRVTDLDHAAVLDALETGYRGGGPGPGRGRGARPVRSRGHLRLPAGEPRPDLVRDGGGGVPGGPGVPSRGGGHPGIRAMPGGLRCHPGRGDRGALPRPHGEPAVRTAARPGVAGPGPAGAGRPARQRAASQLGRLQRRGQGHRAGPR